MNETNKMCSVTTVFSNLASLTCETMCTSTVPREIVNLKQRTGDRQYGRRLQHVPKRSARLQGNVLPSKKTCSGAKKCAIVIPTRKTSNGSVDELYTFAHSISRTDLSAVKVQKRRNKEKNRRQSTESSGSSSGVSTADSKLLQEINNNNSTNKQGSKVTETKSSTNVTEEDTLSLAPDAYYDSCSYESCSLLSLPVIPFPDAAISKVYRKRKREKRKTKGRGRKNSTCKENGTIHCAVDNLSVVEREDKDVADAIKSAKLANLSFLTCESKENVDHCTCGRNVEIMKDEVAYIEHSPNSTKSDSSQDNSENQNDNEVSLQCNY